MAERSRRDAEREFEEQLVVAGVWSLMQTPRGRRVLVVLAIVGVVGYACLLVYRQFHPAAPVAVGPTVRLATWNLHEFSPRASIDLRRIAEIIQSNQFDVVAIQEVRGSGEEVDNLLNALGPPWRAGPYSPTTGNHERFAFLYRGDRVREIGPARQLPAPEASVFARTPWEDSFQAGAFQFTLLTVHLEWSNKALRREEAQTLASVAPRLQAEEPGRHLIVCGDFNEEHAHGNLHLFRDVGWTPEIDSPTNLSSTEDFDNFLIDPSATPQFTGNAGVVAFDQTYRLDRHDAVEQVSDHRPAWAEFRTN